MYSFLQHHDQVDRKVSAVLGIVLAALLGAVGWVLVTVVETQTEVARLGQQIHTWTAYAQRDLDDLRKRLARLEQGPRK